jgi:hypothetical protein
MTAPRGTHGKAQCRHAKCDPSAPSLELVFPLAEHELTRGRILWQTRIESPATLGRKCWAFAYLRAIWPRLRPALNRVTGLESFVGTYDAAIPVTMGLCERVTANCYVNASYDPARNGTCPLQVRQFAVGYYWEAAGGGRGPHPHVNVGYPFPMYDEPSAFHADVQFAVNTTLNFIV